MQGTTGTNDLIVKTYGIDYGPIFDWFVETILRADPDAIREALSFWWVIYSIIAIFVSLLFFAAFVYAKIRYTQVKLS